jgi:hypothetical protein
VQNKPNLQKAAISLNCFSYKGLRKKCQILPRKSKPKQTQSKPKQTQFFARYGTPNPKQTQTNPKQSQFIAAKLACHGEAGTNPI